MTATLSKIMIDEKHILQNLYSLYLHDLSEYTDGLDISPNGSFEFDSFDAIWEGEGMTPYFLKVEDTIVGFLLLLERPFLKKEYDFCINDIFILKKYRRKGYPVQFLQELFSQKKGKYFIIELVKNEPAVLFWKKIYQKLNIKFEEQNKNFDGDDCLIQTFEI
ncbi:GNAT family N-acetyltransferase [Fredinandcohnia humi]